MPMVKSIKGVVRGGRIETAETLNAPEGTEVTITLPVPHVCEPRGMARFGMFADPNRPFSTEEDFREARRSMWGEVDGK